ncbi:hypothetical protein B2K_14800 [Paenibacillus mucilaginosus K02]|uniref:Uncharacterized protein n=1 Tax=Paenibacillus mucilaginosus K02 TaxID=997761 RepID=I0BHX5_9BACL|nr:hypothetical protein B2K_14800 [Paenibacillus mucilaginosus K02]
MHTKISHQKQAMASRTLISIQSMQESDKAQAGAGGVLPLLHQEGQQANSLPAKLRRKPGEPPALA